MTSYNYSYLKNFNNFIIVSMQNERYGVGKLFNDNFYLCCVQKNTKYNTQEYNFND